LHIAFLCVDDLATQWWSYTSERGTALWSWSTMSPTNEVIAYSPLGILSGVVFGFVKIMCPAFNSIASEYQVSVLTWYGLPPCLAST
jgi:hypothetical protein